MCEGCSVVNPKEKRNKRGDFENPRKKKEEKTHIKPRRHDPNLADPTALPVSPPPPPPSPMLSIRCAVMLAVGSWLRSRWSRCVFLLLCSPLLLPIIFASFPLLCAAEICIRLGRRGHRRKTVASDGARFEEDEDERLRRCEEGCSCDGARDEEEEEERKVGLLQRYLEDQLLLVRSMYDCGDDCDFYEDDVDDERDRDRDVDIQSLDCHRAPLLN